MEMPWVELIAAQNEQAYGGQFTGEYPWHAMFACQVCVRPFQERLTFRWGFNNEALLMEALDRQKLFIESQYAINYQYRIELPERPTLALRCINIPHEGLIVSLIGKVCDKSPREAKSVAYEYYRQIYSLIPYDHAVYPATTQEEFQHLTGWDILCSKGTPANIARIKRYETPLPAPNNTESVLGVWQSSLRSNEQIWRALAVLPFPALINVSLRPTILYEQERHQLLKLKNKLTKVEEEHGGPKSGIRHKSWIEPFINRRLSSWGKFFYMQIHLVTDGDNTIDDYLCRTIGAAITRDMNDQPLPGFETDNPPDDAQAATWKKMLSEMEIIQSGSEFYIPRLHDIADLDEAFAVFRFPYPPEGGWSSVTLLDPNAAR
jgi:hypothetical protein